MAMVDVSRLERYLNSMGTLKPGQEEKVRQLLTLLMQLEASIATVFTLSALALLVILALSVVFHGWMMLLGAFPLLCCRKLPQMHREEFIQQAVRLKSEHNEDFRANWSLIERVAPDLRLRLGMNRLKDEL